MARSTHRKRPEQLTLDSVRYHSGRGGPRHGAGRPRGIRPRVMHRYRERIVARVPVHVTIRLRSGIPTLRQPRFVRRFRSSLSEACVRHGFRVVHYSIQRDHVHLLIEAHTNHSIACGMKSVGARIGKLANRLFQRKGKVLDGRYHLRPLTHTARGASCPALCAAQSPASRRAAAQTRPSNRSRESPTRSRQFRPLVRRLAYRHRPSEPYRHPRSRPRPNLVLANRLAPPRAHPSRGRSLKPTPAVQPNTNQSRIARSASGPLPAELPYSSSSSSSSRKSRFGAMRFTSASPIPLARRTVSRPNRSVSESMVASRLRCLSPSTNRSSCASSVTLTRS